MRKDKKFNNLQEVYARSYHKWNDFFLPQRCKATSDRPSRLVGIRRLAGLFEPLAERREITSEGLGSPQFRCF